VGKFTRKSTVMVALYRYQLDAISQRTQGRLNMVSLFGTRAWRMHHISQEYDPKRGEFVANRTQFRDRSDIGEGPEFALTALCPTVS
jgi:hypothetical protein